MITPIDQLINNLRQHMSTRANFFEEGTTGYEAITDAYFWSSSKQPPVGVFQPANAQDVSLALGALRNFPSVPFAIKAGSHIAAEGFNSTLGLLIDMSLFNEVVYHEDTERVDIGPGMLWEGVYAHLKPHQRTANGATSCKEVGVAGFNLGGGYGNKANQLGLAMDTITAMEIVLPTGEIKTVSEKSDREIFWALKGGGNNFGIVTKWTMETYPIPNGGIYFVALNYKYQYFDRVQNAILDYIQKQVPKSNVETKFEWTTTGEDQEPISHAELFYDGPVPPEGLFEAFLDIPHVHLKESHTWDDMIDITPSRRQTYKVGWASDNEDLPPTFRGRYSCVMLSRYTAALIKRIVELAEDAAEGLQENGGLQLYPDIWPGSPTMFQKSPPSAWPHGPDALFPLPIRCLWKSKDQDTYWLGVLASLTEDIRQFAIEQECTKEGVPLYYNLALDGTQVSQIYRDNLPRLAELRRRYDPDGVMDRTGGFRIP